MPVYNVTLNSAVASGSAWGDITGTLADQTDLQSALDSAGGTNYVMQGAPFTSITSTSFVEVNTMTLDEGKKYVVRAEVQLSTNNVASTGIDLLFQTSGVSAKGVSYYSGDGGSVDVVGDVNTFGRWAFDGTVPSATGFGTVTWYIDATGAGSPFTITLKGRVTTGTLYLERYVFTAIEVTE